MAPKHKIRKNPWNISLRVDPNFVADIYTPETKFITANESIDSFFICTIFLKWIPGKRNWADEWLLAIKVFTCNNELQGHGYNLSIMLLGVIASGSLIQVSSVHQVFNYKVHWIIAKLCHSILQGRFLYIHPAGCPPEFSTVYFVQFIYVSCPVGTSSVQNKLKIIWNNVSVHCREEGCFGKYNPRAPRDFPRAEGCKILALGKSLGPRGVYFPIHPSSRQCTDTMSLP